MELGTESHNMAEQQSLSARIDGFRPNLSLSLSEDGFTVKTALHPSEVRRVLELRHEIFIREWQGREQEGGLDLEVFDFIGDHLLIIRESDNKVVGTYRLLCSQFTQRFYSQDEFEMNDFLACPGVKLELGRACIHPEFRNGICIDLLWKGLARYISASKARYLFGCSSVKSEDPTLIQKLHQELSSRNQWRKDFNIHATKDYNFDGFSFSGKSAEVSDKKALRQLLPPLLRSYLHAGASVYGLPAHDRVFACIDLLTILDVEQLNPRFRERFFSHVEAT